MPESALDPRTLARRALPIAQLGARRLLGRKSPYQMTLSLTNRCNFRCEYCAIPLQKRAEMDTGEWRAAIDDLASAGMGRASIIGGEPLLRKDVGAIVRHLRDRGVHASMNTNGWFVPERIDELAALNLVCVTLDGAREHHNRQRHAGSYNRALAAIDALLARGVAVVTMTVVTPSGVEQLEHVLDIARDRGIRAYFQLEHDANMDVALPLARRIADPHVAALAARLAELKARGLPVGNSDRVIERQRTDRLLVRCDRCWAGSYYGYVFSDGTVSHCLLTGSQVPRGNGRDRGFARAFAELPPPVGEGCACVPSHEVNAMLDLDARVVFGALDVALRGRAAHAG